MPSKDILSEDWSDYDNKKKKKEDAWFFACTEDWEPEYLVNKIRKRHPEKTKDEIMDAIRLCCKSVPAPRPRDKFVECVMNRLGLEGGNPGGGGGIPPKNPNPGPHNPPTPPENRKVG